MMGSFYGGTLLMLPGTGELLLFEILLIALLTIPSIAVAYIGAYLGKAWGKVQLKGPGSN
jgi:hypothetical protein